MSLEKTEKELIYELGYHATVLSIWSFYDVNEESFHYIQDFYDPFKTIASKLGINVPNLTEDVLNQQFLRDQITEVGNSINLSRTGAMSQLYECGCAASRLFTSLTMARGTYRRTMEARPNIAPLLLQKLIKCAEDLGEPIDDQLEEELYDICNNYMDSEFHEDLYSIRLRVMKKVCGLGGEILDPSPKKRKRCEVDATRVVTDDLWVVSLVRLPDRSNPEHAFIVLEGKTGRKSKIWFADFVAAQWFGSVEPGTREGKVRMESFELTAVADQTSDQLLLFKCQRIMMDIKETDRWLYTSWSIAKSTAENLIQNIKAQQENPPNFHVFGNNSVFAEGAAELTGNPTGHNCFTFAKKMLRDLNDPIIELPEDDLKTWIVSATSGYLHDKQSRSRKWYKKPSFPLMLLFLAVIVVAYFLFKTMNVMNSLDNFICYILASITFL